LIIGNGDVRDMNDARAKTKEFGVDGVMLGRAIFGNPWLFSSLPQNEGKQVVPSISEKLKVLVEHTKLFEKLLGKTKSFAVMKKHFKAYVNGFEGAKEFRMKLMNAKNAKEVESMIDSFSLD